MPETSPRTAVVIGGASGIGRATALAFARDGYAVTVADLDLAGAEAVATSVSGFAVRVDVTDEASVSSMFDLVRMRAGSVQAVVNTAGIGSFSALVDHDVAEFRRVVDLNLTGAFIVLKQAAKAMADGGALVSLSSLNARQPGAYMAAYCSAKAGVSMLTQVAALELGPRGIRVNAIAPGLVITPLTEALQTVPGVQEDYLANTALGRSGTPEEIASAALYLCSEQASWITGEVLDINGGAHLLRYPDVAKHVETFLSQAGSADEA